MQRNTNFLAKLDKAVLSKIYGEFGYTVLLGVVELLSILVALGAMGGSKDSAPFFQLFYVTLLAAYPAVGLFSQCVGSAHALPVLSLRSRAVHFLLGMALAVVSVGAAVVSAVLYLIRF